MSVAVLFLLSATSPQVHAGPSTAIVGLEDAGRIEALEALAAQLGATRTRCWTTAAQCVVDLPASSFPEGPARAALEAQPGVTYVEADGLMPLVSTASPLDAGEMGLPGEGSGELPLPAPAPGTDLDGTTACPDLWDLDTIRLGDAWEYVGSDGDDAPVVAIQDGGFPTTHEDLDGTYSGGLDYGDNDWDVGVEWSVGVPAHGTFIGGIVASRDDNDIGRVGVIPDGQLNYQKIADSSGSFYWSYAIAAMNDLADGDLGVRVLNYSIASSSYTSGFEDAVDALGDADILLAAAAGNCSVAECSDADNDANPLYPANFAKEHVLSVAGSTSEDALNSYSHYGASTVDLAAPGVYICSLGVTSDTDTYTASGTSYATPLVAGVAALMWEAHPDLRAYEVARMLRASAVETEALQETSRADGRLDALNAVQAPMPRSSEPEDLSFGDTTGVQLELTNAGAAGDAQILLLHDESLEVASAGDWALTQLAPGDTVTLFDVGEHTLGRHGALLEGSLDTHEELALPVEIVGWAEGSSTATLRCAQSRGRNGEPSPDLNVAS